MKKKIVVFVSLMFMISSFVQGQSSKNLGIFLGLHQYKISGEEEEFFTMNSKNGFSFEGLIQYDLSGAWVLWTGLGFISSQIDTQDYSVTFGTDLTGNGFDLARSYMKYKGVSQSLSIPIEVSYELSKTKLVPYVKMGMKGMLTFNDNIEVRVRESGMPERTTVFPESITRVFGVRVGSAIGLNFKSNTGSSFFLEFHAEYMPKAYRENLPGFLLSESSRRDLGLKSGVMF